MLRQNFRFDMFLLLYLKIKKLQHWLRIDKISKREAATGIRGLFKSLYSTRDWIIARASNGLKSEEDRRLLASMFFGYRGLLSPDEKESFQRSGTIHLCT